jgi:hypothetical protein
MENTKVLSHSKLEGTITLTLSELEARALRGITLYGSEGFLKVFYDKLGKSTVQPYEKGIISLFETIRKELPQHLDKFDKARKALQ